MYSYYFSYPYDSYSSYGSYYDRGNFVQISLILLGIIFVAFAISLVFYIFNAISLYTIAKNRGMKKPFLAFIPVANAYYLGKISDDISATMGKKTSNGAKILTFLIIDYAIIFLLAFASFVMIITEMPALIAVVFMFYFAILAMSICAAVFEYISLYRIFKEYSPENAVLFIVLSIVISSVSPFLLFAIRNKKSGYQLWCEQQEAMRAAQASHQQVTPVIEAEPAAEESVTEQTVKETESGTEQIESQPIQDVQSEQTDESDNLTIR